LDPKVVFVVQLVSDLQALVIGVLDPPFTTLVMLAVPHAELQIV
jgi:hypothetical protein